MGPEQNISRLSDRLDGLHWAATGVGFGVRGSHEEELTLRLRGKVATVFLEFPKLTDTTRHNRVVQTKGTFRPDCV